MEIEDKLLMAAKAVAVQRRTSLRAIVEHALRREIEPKGYNQFENENFRVNEDGIPQIRRSGEVKVTNEDIYKLMEDEGV